MVLAQDLRDAVLQAALQGKLTKQLETDSSVDELLIKIKENKTDIDKKELLVKKGAELFEIPKTWKWVYLGSIADIKGGKRVPVGKSLVDNNTGHKYIRVADMQNGTININSIKYITDDVYELIKNYYIKKEDIYITVAGTIGRVGIVPPELDGANLTENADKIIFSNLNKQWFLITLSSNTLQVQIRNLTKKVGQPKLALKRIKELLIPLPPIEEQQRIVDRVNELMERIDEYEKVEKELIALEQRFPNDMKNALLQAAMQGKLTEQLDSDSSVDEMLETIKEEKKQLIKEKMIKKEKALPPIDEDDIPFEIPGNWRWVRLAKIGEIIGGGTPKTTESAYWNNGSIPWITPADMNGCGMFIGKGNKSITKEGLANSSAQLIPKDSVVISSRAPIGYISIAENELSTSQGCKTFSAYCKTKVLSKYIYFVIIYSTSDLIKRATGTTFKEISAKGVGETIIPLPPIEEQQRIVEKLEQLLLLCETL